jgi:hypothetical protein
VLLLEFDLVLVVVLVNAVPIMDISKLPTALANMQFSSLNTALLGITLLVACLLVSYHFSNRPCGILLTQFTD